MTSAVQQSIFDIILDLTRIDHRLAEVRASIHLPPDLEKMQQDLTPYTVEAHVSGIIDCVRCDLLGDTIETLKRAGEVTAADLRDEYYDWIAGEKA